MNWSEEDKEMVVENPPIEQVACELFIGDKGKLSFETRRALIQLLLGPSLDSKRHPKLWPVLIRDEALIRGFLSELFLELVIDSDLQVAFTRQADTGELEVPLLLRRAPLTFIDSILLLHLRQKLTQAGSQGERAVISSEEILEYLALFEPSANTDHSGFIKRVYASIEKIKKYNILQKIRSTEDRFEISATLKLLFSAEEILSLTHLYKKMSAGVISSEENVVAIEEDEL